MSGQTPRQPPYCSTSEPEAEATRMKPHYGTLANWAIFVLLLIWLIHTW